MTIENGRRICGNDLVNSNRLDDASLRILDKSLQAIDVGQVGLRNAMCGEFLLQSGLMNDLRFGRIPARGTIPSWWQRKRGVSYFLIKPNETRLLYAQGSREIIRNSAKTYREKMFHDFEQAIGNPWSLLFYGNGIGRLNIATIYPAWESAAKQRCRIECDHSGLRLLIACQRYERRNGHLPAKLDDLVPALIEAVPRDPYDGQPLRYAADRRIIWAVGENLKDDGGSKMNITGSGEMVVKRMMLDHVIDIPPLIKP